MTNSKPQEFLTTEEVARLVRQSPRTVTEWACRHEETGGLEGIPGTKIGRRWLFDRATINDLLAGKGPVKSFPEVRRA